MKTPTLGSLIATARKQKGLTQVEVCNLIGYKYNVVAKWEQGGGKLTISEWESLKGLLAPELDLAAAEPLLNQGLVMDGN